MMDKFPTDPKLYTIFQKDIWDGERNATKLRDSLQKIVNNWAQFYGLPKDICCIKLKHMRNPAEQGSFNHKTKELFLSYELVVEKLKPPYYENGYHVENVVSNKETMAILAHEFRHAMQTYYRTHPEMCLDKEYLKMLVLNAEHNQNKDLFAYFSDKKGDSELLYMLQFTERDAFIFSDGFCKAWTLAMRDRYPEDLSFATYYDFAKFDKRVEEAKDVFDTQTPFVDVDNLVFHINGLIDKDNVNKDMLDVAYETQTKNWLQRTTQSFTSQITALFPFDMHGQQKTSAELENVVNLSRDLDEHGRTQ